MSEIPNQGIKVSFAAVGAALHCVNAIPGTPFANDIEAAVEAAAPFLRKQFEVEHPVLAVIERAESKGLEVTLWSYVREQRRLCEIELSGANDGPSVLDERTDDPKGSLDECARELLAHWPER